MKRFFIIILDWSALTRDERWQLTCEGLDARRKVALRALITERVEREHSIQAKDMDHAFTMLNADSRPYPGRSLSVGDIIMDEDCREWIVGPIGFDPLHAPHNVTVTP